MRLALILLALSIARPFDANAQTLPALQGDSEAVARIEKMYSQIGGRKVWAQAKFMTLNYRQQRSQNRPGEGTQNTWHDLTRPRERSEWIVTGRDGKTIRFGGGYNETTGWRRRPDGVVEDRSPESLKAITDFWKRDFYTLFRRMAAGDTDIRYKFQAPNRVDMTDASGASIGFWEIDEAGWLLRWGATDSSGESWDWYYGPYKRFGNIAFPSWAVSPSFWLRVEWLDVRISSKPFPEALLTNPQIPPSPKLLQVRD